MNTNLNHYEREIIMDLLKEISEINTNFKSFSNKCISNYSPVKYPCAFNPSVRIEDATYQKNIMLINEIHDVLNGYHINIKSSGYVYIEDAVCIISDFNTLDVCLSKDVYPIIAAKYKTRSISRIEHNIRNAIDSGYKKYILSGSNDISPMHYFKSKPTNKEFILHVTQEVNGHLWNDLCSS